MRVLLGVMVSASLLLWVFPVMGQVPPIDPGPVVQDIEAGIDIFRTPAGSGENVTTQDFSDTPIQAGFFDFDSRQSDAYGGTIRFKGTPLKTSPARKLGNTDTVVERMEDAVFSGAQPVTIPIIIRALSLKSTTPITVTYDSGQSSEEWEVTAGLSSVPQTEGTMTIVPETDTGGTFSSALLVQPKMRFTLKSDPSVFKDLDFGVEGLEPIEFAATDAPWAYSTGRGGVEYENDIMVDTDGDGIPDTWVPGTSNFAAGWGLSQDILIRLWLRELALLAKHAIWPPGWLFPYPVLEVVEIEQIEPH